MEIERQAELRVYRQDKTWSDLQQKLEVEQKKYASIVMDEELRIDGNEIPKECPTQTKSCGGGYVFTDYPMGDCSSCGHTYKQHNFKSGFP
mmetsp:Transcript_32960/g.51528  ORF Transcript_32960/g.51528 Transcript_32960/m.51528 type:complete len:91 (-) Transcript_32960:77-349(-)